MMPDLESKRLELLRELMPALKRVAFLGSTRDPAANGFIKAGGAAAATIGVELIPYLVNDFSEIDGMLQRIVQDKIDAVIVQPILALSTVSAAKLAELAARHRIASITNFASFARAGGLMSYGPDPDFGRRAVATYVDKILKGANPGDLPIEQPSRFQLVINLKSAALLGIKVPTSILLQANEVIE